MSKNICADNPISFLGNLKTGAQGLSFTSVEVERIYIFLTCLLAFCCGENNQEFLLLSREATGVCGNKNNLTFHYDLPMEWETSGRFSKSCLSAHGTCYMIQHA